MASRLEELRLIVTERRLEAELERGRHADVLADVRELAPSTRCASAVTGC